eukprot:TRINITY_DN5240_c0_g1_i16.p1 TRINITY_DN5240_c0_g1~~TRINITY_DN5240_c0_g1_i16.p1  ORF type:complete len:242 (-),score=84.25 TRINITY_DN5240_c0_g1_i16:192-872(-)
MLRSLVGSEMCIRDRYQRRVRENESFAMASSHGFRNCAPVGREERKAANDKESIEKQRLRDRREEFFAFEEPVPRAEGGVSASVPGSVGWIPESDRFNTDSAYMLRAHQEGERQVTEDFYDARREATVRREEERWERMETEESKNAEIDANCAESRSRKNAGSAPFDLLTLQYHDTPAGENLASLDQGARERQFARSSQMYDNANRSGFNPVTGESNAYHSSNRCQ